MIKAIAFDLDGTLCDTIPDLTTAANATRNHFDLPEIPEARVRTYIGDGVGELIHRTLTDDHNGIADKIQWQKALNYFTQYYADHIADNSHPYPDCEEVLQVLSQKGLKLAVITNKEEELARKLLTAFDLLKYFQVVIGGNSLPKRKPDPMMITTTAEKLEISPVGMLMVGDSVNDILVSKNAGCRSVLVSYGYGDVKKLQADEKTRADVVINYLRELEELC